MADLRDIYTEKAILQIPRLLSLQDRNPFSPTYGCFHRDYWLYKTSDFPDAVRQFAVHALALVYKHDFPGNIYKNQPKVCDWTIAGLDFWANIQHKDGSFDEFYPYERGWVGPSAFTTYTAIEAYRLLEDEIPPDVRERILSAIGRAARFISAGESEEDHLANHHAMACLAVWKACELLDDPNLKRSFERLWEGFLRYHNNEEGWSREYDGVDPGYLSATVSFLGKIYKSNPDSGILNVLRQSVDFCSYFVYPNGFYAGSMGSRNTLHFYPHGFEVMAGEIPLAAAVAEKMLRGLAEGKLVPPEIMSDRYVVYRVPEFLLAYIDYGGRPAELPLLPYEQSQPFTRYFPASRIFVASRPRYYMISNLAKGGVIKVFDRRDGQLILNDCGLIGRLEDGRVVSSQWIDPSYECSADDNGWAVSGHLHIVPSNKLFTPFKNLIFRTVLVMLGWIPAFSHLLKGQIRKALILGQHPVPVRFCRSSRLDGEQVTVVNEIEVDKNVKFSSLSIGDEFFVRYVPQSRFFQNQELGVKGYHLKAESLSMLNSNRRISIKSSVNVERKLSEYSIARQSLGDTPLDIREIQQPMLPKGVYDIDYYMGRKEKRQLIYRLRRRTDEVEKVLRSFNDGCLRVVVDVGTADGLMLYELRRRMRSLTFVGFDMSFALLSASSGDGVHKVQGDALHMPVRSGIADAAVATAVIEHVIDPSTMLRECARILRPGGLLVLTTPDPFMEYLASTIGILKEEGHQQTLNLTDLRQLVEENGFAVLDAHKFMLSPIGLPGEKWIERIFESLGLSILMANQLLVARCK